MAVKRNVLPMVEVARLCLAAGFTPWRSVIVTAVIQAESGCDAYAVGLNDHDATSRAYLSLDLGLCQWNTLFWNELAAPKDRMSIRDMFTPEASIAKMFVVSKGGFLLTPWHAFTNNFHTRHLTAARAAVREAGGNV